MDLSLITSGPALFLLSAVAALWIARSLMNIVFRVGVVAAVAGIAVIISGAPLPFGLNIDDIRQHIQSFYSLVANYVIKVF